MAKEEKETKRRFGAVNFELRKYPRYSLELPIEYWETENRQNYHGRTINISEGGLMLFIAEEIEIGQNLKLKIFFGSSLNQSFIEAQVEVVWKDIHWMSEKDYRIGVKFVDISSGDKEKLENLLKKNILLKTPQTEER
jgi:c-di-GMP-binding flagellar brake protein YcgR